MPNTIQKTPRCQTHETCMKFFHDFDKKDLVKKDGIIIVDGFRTRQDTYLQDKYLDEFTVDGIHVYGKAFSNKSVFSTAASQMLYELDHITPRQTFLLDSSGHIRTITEDIKWLENLELEVAPAYLVTPLDKLTLSLLKIEDFRINEWYEEYGSWAPLFLQSQREKFLEFMTEECFDAFVAHFLLAELRTDSDRHQGNFYLVRSLDSDKYEAIISIDLDRAEIIQPTGTIDNTSFKNFINNIAYSSRDMYGYFTPEFTYSQRIHHLQKLIQSGNLTEAQIMHLRNGINYDLPQTILAIKNKYNTHKTITHSADETYSKTSRLWEYNHKEIGRELNL